MMTRSKLFDSPLVDKLLIDPKFFLETLVDIVNKDRKIIPFIFNPSQLRYYLNKTLRDVILKPRQVGFSSLIMGLFLHDTMFSPNTTSIVVAHTIDSSMYLFEKALYMFNSVPEEFRPHLKYRNRKELYFDHINSSFYVGSAESKDFGRGRTPTNLLCSEVSSAAWTKDFIDGLLEGVPRNGVIVMEATARGEGGLYYDYYFDAKAKLNGFKNHYFRWFEHAEYREPLIVPREDFIQSYDYEELALVEKYNLIPEQIYWRRLKKSRLRAKFIQEYPEWEDVDAFIKSGSNVFDVDWLSNRDKELPEQFPAQLWLGGELYIYKIAEPGAKYIIGGDCSEGDINSDYSAAMVNRIWPLPIEQVALLHGRWTPDIFSEKMYKLGRAYNYALLAPERNNHGHAVLLNLANGIVRKGAVVYPSYPNLYIGSDKKLGWHTGPISKPQMIDELDRAIRADELIVNSKQFIQEARRFVTMKASTGKFGLGVPPSVGNDDIVMAEAIALGAISGAKFDFSFE